VEKTTERETTEYGTGDRRDAAAVRAGASPDQVRLTAYEDS
jgi:hypothetical protein